MSVCLLSHQQSSLHVLLLSSPTSHVGLDEADVLLSASSNGDTSSNNTSTVILTLSPSYKWLFTNTHGQDVFTSREDALKHIETEKHPGVEFTMSVYERLVGSIVLDKMYILVVEKSNDVLMLPHCTVSEVLAWKWIPLVTEVPPIYPHKAERETIAAVLAAPLNPGFYFCKGGAANFASPFPFLDPTLRDWFTSNWFHHLQTPFVEDLHLPSVCTRLSRGFVSNQSIKLSLGDTDGVVDANVTLIGRQAYRNPGPRFFSRGLNRQAGAGNELVYELVLSYVAEGGLLRYAKHTFLRGTVPLHFTSTLQGAVGEAMITVPPKASELTPLYFSRLLKKIAAIISHDKDMMRLEDPQHAVAALLPRDPLLSPRLPKLDPMPSLLCLNLLREVSKAGEDVLSQAYADAVKAITTKPPNAFVGRCNLCYDAFDWLAVMKSNSVSGAVEELWRKIDAFVVDVGGGSDGGSSFFSAGSVEITTRIHEPQSVQSHFVRYNCADSLDRTNLAGFFESTKIIADLVKALHPSAAVVMPPAPPPLTASSSSTLSNDVDEFLTRLMSPKRSQQQQQQHKKDPFSPEAIAAVASAREKQQQQVPQIPNKYDDIKTCVPGPLLTALVRLFVANGDTIATLYTSSPALSTGLMRDFVPGMESAQMNAVISSQRRYQNVFEDSKRMRAVEVLQGVNSRKLLPFRFGAFLQPLPPSHWSRALVVDGGTAEAVETLVEAVTRHLSLESSQVENCWVYRVEAAHTDDEKEIRAASPTNVDDVETVGAEIIEQSNESDSLLVSVNPDEYDADAATDVEQETVVVLLFRSNEKISTIKHSFTISMMPTCASTTTETKIRVSPYLYRVQPTSTGFSSPFRIFK
eukprot:PhM_4_TR8445/c0_g1_i2/m.51358